jgi:hypothetical protein
MTLITTLTLVHENEESAYYAETPGKEKHHPLLGAVTVQKWALSHPTPTAIRLTIETYEAEQPTALRHLTVVTPPTDDAEGVLRQGAHVTVVKNRMAGINQPPEWLGQYLGRKGTVLWTTAGGAMVKLDDQATWFPYAELKVEG